MKEGREEEARRSRQHKNDSGVPKGDVAGEWGYPGWGGGVMGASPTPGSPEGRGVGMQFTINLK